MPWDTLLGHWPGYTGEPRKAPCLEFFQVPTIQTVRSDRDSERGAGLTSELLEDDGQRAKPSEGGLEEVEAHECGEPKPIGTKPVGQAEGEQNKKTGKGQYDAFDGHG